MRRTPQTLALCFGLAAFFAIGSGSAQDSVLLRDGRLIEGEVLRIAEGELRLLSSGSTVVILPLADVEPTALYFLWRTRLAPGDAPARLELAEFCVENGLGAFAAAEYRQVLDIDPSLEGEVQEGLAAVDEGRAEALYREAEEMASGGRRDEERRLLDDVVERFPGTQAAILASAELHQLDRSAERRAEREARRQERIDERNRRRAEILHRYLTFHGDRALERRNEAADQTNFAQGRRLLLEAVEAFDRLIPYAVELAKYDPEQAAVWRERIKNELIGLYHMLTVVDLESQNSRQANHWITQTLLLDPHDLRAKELRDINITYGIERDPWRMSVGELGRKILRRSASGEEVRAFLRRTGNPGRLFLQQNGINIPP